MFGKLKRCFRMTAGTALAGAEPRTFHWRDGHAFGNFGDALTLLYKDLFFEGPSLVRAGTIHLVGSVITENRLNEGRRNGFSVNDEAGRSVFWGCGKKDGAAIAQPLIDTAIFLGVRGALTRDALGLAATTPLGDTALLLPRFYEPRHQPESYGKVLWVPHIHHPALRDEDIAGPDACLIRSPAIPNTVEAVADFIDTIASASFVMANAMHAAVVAMAYGVPFAFWSGRYVNVPFKWQDLTSAMGFDMPFASDFAQAERIYDRVRPDQAFANWDPEPLMAVAPFRLKQASAIRLMPANHPSLADESPGIGQVP